MKTIQHALSGDKYILDGRPTHIKYKGVYGYLALLDTNIIFFYSDEGGVNYDYVTDQFIIL